MIQVSPGFRNFAFDQLQPAPMHVFIEQAIAQPRRKAKCVRGEAQPHYVPLRSGASRRLDFRLL